MATEIHQKFGTAITAQASAAITADAYSGGSSTDLVAGTSGNGEGAFRYDLFADVTTAPSGGDAILKVYDQANYENAGWDTDLEEYCLHGVCADGLTGNVYLGWIVAHPYDRLRLYAEDYGLTASLVAVPVLPESQ